MSNFLHGTEDIAAFLDYAGIPGPQPPDLHISCPCNQHCAM